MIIKSRLTSNYSAVARLAYYKKQELITLREHLSSAPRLLVGSVFLIFLVFLCCPIICGNVLSSMLWYLLQFRHNTMFGSSLPSVICRRVRVLFRSFVFVCVQWCPTHSVVFSVLLVFILCFVYPMPPVSLDCPFWIVPSVFSDVCLKQSHNWICAFAGSFFTVD